MKHKQREKHLTLHPENPNSTKQSMTYQTKLEELVLIHKGLLSACTHEKDAFHLWILKLNLYIVSSSTPFKKALFTSNCITCQLLKIATESTTQMFCGLTTGLKVSLLSILGVWWKPLATKHVLYLWMVPSAFFLSLKTHFDPTIL